MPRKRRKLSKEMEAEMAAAKRKIELIMALIHDIRDDDIQGEYLEAFGQIRSAVVNLVAKYTTCLLYTSPSPRDKHRSRMPSSA